MKVDYCHFFANLSILSFAHFFFFSSVTAMFYLLFFFISIF